MRHPRLLLLTLTAAAIVGATSIGVWAAGSRSADAGVTTVSLLIDCDVSQGGIQSNCEFPAGTTSAAVDVVLVNHTSDFVLGGFNLRVDAAHAAGMAPASPACAPPATDCNPDLLVPTAAWTCSPPLPVPDQNPSGSVIASLISCFHQPGGPDVVSGTPLPIVRVNYQFTESTNANFTLDTVNVFDVLGVEMGSCNPGPDAECGTAYLQIGDDTPTPSPTYTHTPTPTATPGPEQTPVSSPTGAVSDVIGLNSAVCIFAPIAKLGVPGVVMLFNCPGIGNQVALQTIVSCMTENPACPSPPFNEVLRPEPALFESIDVDGNQVHAGQTLAMLAFVDGEYPVLFETDRGHFLDNDGAAAGATVLCYAPVAGYSAVWDPDCDANLSTEGDGVVAARVAVDLADPRGPGQVTVTQNGVSKVLDFTVVGPPQTITMTSLDGKTEITTAALPRTVFGQPALANACDSVVSGPLQGSTAPPKSHLFVQAFDSDGTPVAGAVVAFLHAADGAAAVFRNSEFPVGGMAGLVPTWDFGADGIGGVAVPCGGIQAGLLDLEAKFDDGTSSNINWSPFANFDFVLPFSMPVVAGDQDGDGFLDELLLAHSGPANADTNYDNCIFAANPTQANPDGNFVENGPNHSVDDLTLAYSDEEGDACDADDDNDWLPDLQETTGSWCNTDLTSVITDPRNPDTDGDRVLDRAECDRGTDPTDPASKPANAYETVQCGGYPDFDGDGLQEFLENCYYGTSNSNEDFDNDGVFDGCEVASLNDDHLVNSGDQLLLAMEYTRTWSTALTPHPNFDLNKDGRVNAGDQFLMAKVMALPNPCTEDLPD